MKRRGLIFLFFLFLRSMAVAIDNEIIDANGNLLPRSKNVYIAIRNDGLAGSGAKSDPYDASTAAKYTALLSSLQPDYIFHYAVGTYETYGWLFRSRKTAGTGCKHYGAGIDRTIIRLVGASNGPADGVVFGSFSERADGFEVHDLTIDCNAAAQPKWSSGSARFVAGIQTRGSNITISRVKVIGFGTHEAGTECFPLYVAAFNVTGDFSNNVVENCIISNPAKGNLDGAFLISVGVVNATPGAAGHNNVARNNYIDMTGHDFPIAVHGAQAQLIENNFIKGCSDGVYAEPPFGGTARVIVRNNNFVSCGGGVRASAHVGSSVEGFLIESNLFTDCSAAVSISADDRLVHYREVIVRENRHRKSDGTVSIARAIHILSTDKAVVERNVLDSAERHAIYVNATSSRVGENRTSKGMPVSDTHNNVPTPQGGLIRP